MRHIDPAGLPLVSNVRYIRIQSPNGPGDGLLEVYMKHHQIDVRAVWDEEAQVWVATSDDIQGLAIEADTLDLLRGKIVPAIEDLIEMNRLHSGLQEVTLMIRSEESTKVLIPCH